MATQNLPARTGTDASQEALPSDNNPTTTTEILAERLQAWKHMCGYLEDYINEVAKDQKSQAKDQEKILKSLSHPLREGHHFEQALGGVGGLFENLRSNTQAQITLHGETSKNLTGAVLPILERLHSEIKSKSKELEKGAGKGTKAVESARTASQKHIELLGQHTAGFDAAGTKTTATTDPYVVQRQIWHRLNKQLGEENNNRGDLISVQNSFQQFEAHVLSTVQNALQQLNQYMSAQAERQKHMYADVAATASKIPPDFEWNGFLHRNSEKLINPNAPQRDIKTVTFPNQDHRSTKALIEGTLERKGRGLSALGGYSSGYYALTPAGYLHEFKDNDNFIHDPVPEHSLYIPDSVIGAVDGERFTIKGKDTSGGKLSQKLSRDSEYQFKAHNSSDAQQWHSIISSLTQSQSSSLPTSPVEEAKISPLNTQAAAATTEQNVASPTSAGAVQPQSAASAVPQSATGTTAPHATTTAGQVAAPAPTAATAESAGAVPQSATSATAPNPTGVVPEQK